MHSSVLSCDRSLNPPAVTQLSPIYLFADDLTGACDAAAAFLPAGHSVRVWLGSKALHSTPESLQAFNTSSRTLAPVDAGLAVTRSAASHSGKRNSLFFKKIDSALRGPLATELLAAHRTLGTEAILVAPSFPSAGRTVRNGVLNIRDAAGQDTQRQLATLFPRAIQPLIAIVAHPEEIASARALGKSILLCDAVTQEDLKALAQYAAGLPGLLYAGSAGLAQAIASLVPASLPPQPLPHAGRTLIIAGTQHPVARLQLDRLAVDHPAAQTLCICFAEDDEAQICTLFHQTDPQALILTGGDTALLAARALDAHSFVLRGEFAPGIPWGIIQGGPADGRVVITKSGGFGSPSTLSELFATLTGQA